MTDLFLRLKRRKDQFWVVTWFVIVLLLSVWDLLFLNKFAFHKLFIGFVSTVFIAFLVTVFTLLNSIIVSNLLLFFQRGGGKPIYILLQFVLNIIKSIPQIVGVLASYIFLATLYSSGIIDGKILLFSFLAFMVSIFVFSELNHLIVDRVEYFKKLDFYNAMRVCGISEFRIINFDILWKNSRLHIFNKLISVFGMAVFLQCSVDFIISVGLSTKISSVDLPVTLGSLLADYDSKKDILAIGYTLTHPTYLPHLFFEHLQGMSVAFLLVFTLLSVYKISNGFARRYKI